MLSTHTVAVAVRTVSLYTPIRTRDALKQTVAVAVRTVSLYTPVRTRDALKHTVAVEGTDCKSVHSSSYKGCSQHTPWLWLYGL